MTGRYFLGLAKSGKEGSRKQQEDGLMAGPDKVGTIRKESLLSLFQVVSRCFGDGLALG